MDVEPALSAAAVLALLGLAGCVLDVILRPVPLLAPARQRRRRAAFHAGIVALLLLALLTI